MEPIKCPHCGAELTCDYCGQPLKTKEAIESAIADGQRFCGQCGKEIASTLEQALAKFK